MVNDGGTLNVYRHSDAGAALQNDVSGQGKKYKTRDDRQVFMPSNGITLPAAPKRSTWDTRSCFPKIQFMYICTWLFLAQAYRM